VTATPTFAELEKMTPAQQDSFFTGYFATFKGTVTGAWVANDPALKPYEGDTALEMYGALKTAFPTATPLQRGSTVYQAWLVNGTGSAVQKIVGASGAALGAVATGVETASIVPSWADGLASFLADLTSSGTWIRVAKVAIGGVLVIVGLVQLTGTGKVIEDVVK
jgi:hypothetical protein